MEEDKQMEQREKRLKIAEQETEVVLYTDEPDKKPISRRKSQGQGLAGFLNENYMGEFSEAPAPGERESRALSQDAIGNDKSMANDKSMGGSENDFDMDMGSIDDEGEPDIVLIEEEYKSMLEESVSERVVTRQDFKFRKLIGSGAHAQVYLAQKIDDQKLYAVKVLDKKELNKKKQVKGTKVERMILVSIL